MTASDVARWMLKYLDEHDGWLDQSTAATDIERLFGGEFVYANDNGNVGIHRTVLAEFRKLSRDTVVWSSADKAWRRRTVGDDPSLRRDD